MWIIRQMVKMELIATTLKVLGQELVHLLLSTQQDLTHGVTIQQSFMTLFTIKQEFRISKWRLQTKEIRASAAICKSKQTTGQYAPTISRKALRSATQLLEILIAQAAPAMKVKVGGPALAQQSSNVFKNALTVLR